MVIPSAINELIDPSFNGSGLLDVIVAASGAERRARQFAADIQNMSFNDIPEIVDYSLILKNTDATETAVRQFSDIWHDATTETYVGMPEQYRDTFETIKDYVNALSGVVTTSRIPLFFVSGITIDTDILLWNAFGFPDAFRQISKRDKKKFTGGMNLSSVSGSIDPFEFVGGNGPSDLLYDSSYNGIALAELITAFDQINPSGSINLLANPSEDLSNDSINSIDQFGWIAFIEPRKDITLSAVDDLTANFELTDAHDSFAEANIIIPIDAVSGQIFNINIDHKMKTIPIDNTSLPTVLGLSPTVTSHEFSANISASLLNSNFDEIAEIVFDGQNGTLSINDVANSNFNVDYMFNGSGETLFLFIETSMVRSNLIEYTQPPLDETIPFSTASGFIETYEDLFPNLRYRTDFLVQVNINNSPVIWSGFIDGRFGTGSGIIYNYNN